MREGLTLLKQMKIFRPDMPVILMTAWGSIPLAVEGIHAGAFDFITKPWDNRNVLEHVKAALDIAGHNDKRQPYGIIIINYQYHDYKCTIFKEQSKS